MFRSFSTKRSDEYERLDDESSVHLLKAKLDRARSLPAKVLFGSSTKSTPEWNFPANAPAKQAKKVNKAVHPLFGMFDARRRKKKTCDGNSTRSDRTCPGPGPVPIPVPPRPRVPRSPLFSSAFIPFVVV
ncbi:hypothetical protein Vadar_000331 [Vaccinium darrowii]|uniref:Uncharacterized protein n=1 Tax=Vaccinium darrowii TaxID=229202 RepID=A0ACB7Z1K5_9ERIC|nr:hypothetical protein Vadar_000331 [Vaccinium darrowii]